jgi:PST family polysaccharide transporter
LPTKKSISQTIKSLQDKSRLGLKSDHPEPLPTPSVQQVTTLDGIYVGARYGLGILIGLANMFALTWWIGPHAYGIFVTVIGLSAFLGTLTRVGADTYLVRREAPPDERLYNVAATLIACISVGLVTIGTVAVPALMHWFSSREFVFPYLATLVTVPISGIAGPPIAKLERDLNFRTAAGIELTGQFLALTVSAVLAWQRLGVWAPVAGVITSQTFVALAAWQAAQIKPCMVFDAIEIRAMLSFGLGYTLSLRVWQLRALVNPLLIGRILGAEAVAFVALAVRIAESLGFVRSAAGRLAVAGLSRLHSEPDRFRRAIQKGLELQVLTIGPLLCVFAAVAPALIVTLFGSRWSACVQLYPWVALAILINSVFNLQASGLYVLEEQWAVLWSYCAHIVVFASVAYLLASRIGIRGYGWADVVACISYWWLHRKLSQRVRVSYRRIASWLFVFGLPLFTPTISSAWKWSLWVPLILVSIFHARQLSRTGASSRATTNETEAKSCLLRHDPLKSEPTLELSQP